MKWLINFFSAWIFVRYKLNSCNLIGLKRTNGNQEATFTVGSPRGRQPMPGSHASLIHFLILLNWLRYKTIHYGAISAVQRPNSWTDKSPNGISSLLIIVTSTALPWDFYFFKLVQPLTVSTPYRKPYPPSLWFKKYIQKPQFWELSRWCPETSMKLYEHVHELAFRTILIFMTILVFLFCIDVRICIHRRSLHPCVQQLCT